MIRSRPMRRKTLITFVASGLLSGGATLLDLPARADGPPPAAPAAAPAQPAAAAGEDDDSAPPVALGAPVMPYQGVAPGTDRMPPRAPRLPVKGPARLTWPGFQVHEGVPTIFLQLSSPVEWEVREH